MDGSFAGWVAPVLAAGVAMFVINYVTRKPLMHRLRTTTGSSGTDNPALTARQRHARRLGVSEDDTILNKHDSALATSTYNTYVRPPQRGESDRGHSTPLTVLERKRAEGARRSATHAEAMEARATTGLTPRGSRETVHFFGKDGRRIPPRRLPPYTGWSPQHIDATHPANQHPVEMVSGSPLAADIDTKVPEAFQDMNIPPDGRVRASWLMEHGTRALYTPAF